ncbi:MAG: histidinol dehydrogenase [Alphaproteobacteria bacterium]|nr:histidinol dehydrogenase [Alphaproteobacteria bacterium]
MIPVLKWDELEDAEKTDALMRAPSTRSAELTDRVKDIVERVRHDGDEALRMFSARFDGLDAAPAFVPRQSMKAATDKLPHALRRALGEAIETITAFHSAQTPQPVRLETRPGVFCELLWKPIERVGLYVPGGTAPLFSAVLMLAIPARLAGCKRRVLCTPPAKDGSVNPGILAAADLCGIEQVLPLGGAQAIAAMAFGTLTVPKVDKIFGPGNAYVTQAKQMVAQMPDGAAIDMPAGPSEVMVIADEKANPAFVAADLLAQAEHASDSQAICVTNDAATAEAVRSEVTRQASLLKRRNFIEGSLRASRILIVKELSAAFEIADRYAPEHLILQIENASLCVDKIRNAGSFFIGPWSPETAGDYASGTNHVLPTFGYARAYGGLSLASFMKNMSVQTLTQKGLASLAPTLVQLAEAEGLDAHAAAVALRMEAMS